MNFSTNPHVEAFDELLDMDGTVMVAGMEFYPSDILKNCDPIAYRISVNEYIDTMIEDLRYDLVHTDEDDLDEIEDIQARIEELESYYI